MEVKFVKCAKFKISQNCKIALKIAQNGKVALKIAQNFKNTIVRKIAQKLKITQKL